LLAGAQVGDRDLIALLVIANENLELALFDQQLVVELHEIRAA